MDKEGERGMEIEREGRRERGANKAGSNVTGD